MKKYLLIMITKNDITYELYSSYYDLLEDVSELHSWNNGRFKTKWFRIDNLSDNPLKIFKILNYLNNFIVNNWG